MSNTLTKINYDGTDLIIRDSVLSNSKPVNVLTLGIVNDGTTDCSDLINKYTADFPLYFPAGLYKINKPIKIVHSIYGNGFGRTTTYDGTTFVSGSTDNEYMIEVGDTVKNTICINGIGLYCNNNNNGIKILSHKYMYLENIGVFNFGHPGDGAWAGTNGYRYGIYVDTSPYGQSRSVYMHNISIHSAINSPSIGIYLNKCYDDELSNIEVMFCRNCIRIDDSLIRLNHVHAWSGTTDYSTLTKTEYESTRCIRVANSKLFGTDIYTDSACIAWELYSSIINLTNYINWFDVPKTAYTDATADLIYQGAYSTFNADNVILYIPYQFFGKSHLFEIAESSIHNINYVVDTNPVMYSIRQPTSFDSHYVVKMSTNKDTYKAFLICKWGDNHYGEYVNVRCLLADRVLYDIFVKDDAKTIKVTSLNSDSVDIYYKVENGAVIFYSTATLCEANIITASHNCAVYKMNEFVKLDNTPFFVSQNVTTGLTKVTKNQDVTIYP